jgi:tetratricopeptide (TPR) repeat protein
MKREFGLLSGMPRLGNLMIEMGEWKKAKDIYETLLQQEENPCIIQQLGFIAHQMNNFDEALQHYQRSLSIHLTNLSPDDSRLATLYSNIGCVLQDKGNLKEAHKQFQRALQLELSVKNLKKGNIVSSLGEFIRIFFCTLHLNISSFFLAFEAKIYNNIGILLEKQGHRREALKNMESAVEVLRECLPPTHPEIAALYNNIAISYYTIEDYPNALLNYEKCLDIQKVSLPSQHPDLVQTELYMKGTIAIIQQREQASTQVWKILDLVRCLLPFNYLRNLEIH